MVKILVNNEWYDELSPSYYYENDYENLIYKYSNIIYPDYHFVPFKVRVFDENSCSMPDYALINKTYSHWYVVEIELSIHSFQNHILPQISTLANGYYTQEHADFLKKKKNDLDPSKLFDLVKGKQPEVMVIVNKPVDWSASLKKYDAFVNIVEVFMSTKNKHIFRINGQYPYNDFSPNEISICKFEKILPAFLNIESPAPLEIKANETIFIKFESYMTEWKRIDIQNKVWLVPKGKNPLNINKTYKLIKNKNDYLFIER